MSKFIKCAILGGLIGAGATAYRSYLNDEPVDEMAVKAATTASAGAAVGALVGLIFDRRSKSRESNAALLVGYAAAQKDRVAALGSAATSRGSRRGRRKALKAERAALEKIARYESELAKNVAVLNAQAMKKIEKARKESPLVDSAYGAASAAAGAATPVVQGWMKKARPAVKSSRKALSGLIEEGAPLAKHAYETTVSAAGPLAHKSAERASDAIDTLTPLAREAADRAAKQYYRSSDQAVRFAKQTARRTATNSKPFIEKSREWANEARSEATKAVTDKVAERIAERDKRKPVVVKVG